MQCTLRSITMGLCLNVSKRSWASISLKQEISNRGWEGFSSVFLRFEPLALERRVSIFKIYRGESVEVMKRRVVDMVLRCMKMKEFGGIYRSLVINGGIKGVVGW